MAPGSPRVAGLVNPVAEAVQQVLTATGGDGNGYRFTVEYRYDSVGAMVAVVDPTDNDIVYWRAHASDAAGRVNLESMGNGINTARVFDQATGLLEGISTGYGASSAIQTLTYEWDGMGNLTERYDDNKDLTETFVYDALNRLDYSTLDSGAGAATNLDLTYDAAGNVTAKAMPLTQDGSTDWTYSYGGSQPHAVTAVSGTGSYTYDANGNQLTGPNGREIDWTAFNKPWRIEEGSTENLFLYGPDRGRYKQIINQSSTWQSTTVYVGGLYERVTTSAGNAHRMHLMAGSGVVATIAADQPSGEFVINYFHRDHLGSVSAITDGNGELVVELSYDAHGMRRDPTDWMGPAPAGDVEDANAIVRYGFTGQEQLDGVNLIHMNGRVQDPVVGAFLSSDPIVSSPYNSQAYNRYSYALNQPVSRRDPSGYAPTANGRTFNIIEDGGLVEVPSQERFDRIRNEVAMRLTLLTSCATGIGVCPMGGVGAGFNPSALNLLGAQLLKLTAADAGSGSNQDEVNATITVTIHQCTDYFCTDVTYTFGQEYPIDFAASGAVLDYLDWFDSVLEMAMAGAFQNPSPGAPIVIGGTYGNVVVGGGAFMSPRDGNRLHEGLDTSGTATTPVLAAADGSVIFADPNATFSYGNQVIINHGNGVYTMYGHLTSVLVSSSDLIVGGQQIGTMGNTGNAAGFPFAELHFEVRLGSGNADAPVADPCYVLGGCQ